MRLLTKRFPYEYWIYSYLIIVVRCEGNSSSPQANLIGGSPHWGYRTDGADGLQPDSWKEGFPKCSGQRQSPIPIDSMFMRKDDSLSALQFFRYDIPPVNSSWTLMNNGHVIQFTGNYVTQPEIFSAGLKGAYILEQFHFHWGASNDRGSEHLVNGKKFPLELHIVHRKSSELKEEANDDSAGYAVVAVMFELANDQEPLPNQHLEQLIGVLPLATSPETPREVTLHGLQLADLLSPSTGYYRYFGSLTVPPCYESVVWTVMQQPLKITTKQLEAFRKLQKRTGRHLEALTENNRPLQPLNKRVVTFFPGTPNMFFTSGAVPITIMNNLPMILPFMSFSFVVLTTYSR